jgi:hypothetical protein
MNLTDCRPLAYGPAAERLQGLENRLGAVYSALYSFWSARHAAVVAGQRELGAQRKYDTVYSVLYNLTYGLAAVPVLPGTKDQFLHDGILTASYSSITGLKRHWSTMSQARQANS